MLCHLNKVSEPPSGEGFDMENAASTSTRFLRLENFIEPLRRRPAESNVEAIKRVLAARAKAGWELVDVCQDELRVSKLVFHRLVDAIEPPVYGVGEIPFDESLGSVRSTLKYLDLCLKHNFVPVAIIENFGRKPIAVLRKVNHSCAESKVVAVPLTLTAFGRKRELVKEALFELQTARGMSLACVIHGGLKPVLIAVTNEHDQPYDYHVDQAFGGFYKNQATRLEDLIQARSEEGWHVCASFVDPMQWPCVIFERETITTPALPLQSA